MTMHPEDEPFYWGRQLLACFDDLRPAFARRLPPIVDCEVIPPFDGRPDGMSIWFICERSAGIAGARAQRLELQAAIQERMAVRRFPAQALEVLRSDVTSLEDIDAGGGRFYYFR